MEILENLWDILLAFGVVGLIGLVMLSGSDDEDEEEEVVAPVGSVFGLMSDNDQVDLGPTPAARRHGNILVDGHRSYNVMSD